MSRIPKQTLTVHKTKGYGSLVCLKTDMTQFTFTRWMMYEKGAKKMKEHVSAVKYEIDWIKEIRCGGILKSGCKAQFQRYWQKLYTFTWKLGTGCFLCCSPFQFFKIDSLIEKWERWEHPGDLCSVTGSGIWQEINWWIFHYKNSVVNKISHSKCCIHKPFYDGNATAHCKKNYKKSLAFLSWYFLNHAWLDPKNISSH